MLLLKSFRCSSPFLIALILSACGSGQSATPNTSSTDASTTMPSVINGIQVPPMPNPAINNATLLGVDSNNNGVRDDVEIYIAQKYGKNPIQYKAMMQSAKAAQLYLEANGDPTMSTKAMIEVDKASDCSFYAFGNDAISSEKKDDDIMDQTFNSKERFVAYTKSVKSSTLVLDHVENNAQKSCE